MRRYSQDPYWITARYNTQCSCGKPISMDDRAYYYPKGKIAVCEQCGRKGEADIIADDENQIYHCC